MKKLFILMMTAAVITALLSASLCVYAASTVSEIKIAVGKTATDELEKSGYTVIYQNLNTENGKTEIYMGYKTGAEAVTGLAVSSEKKSELFVGDIRYTLLSEEDLNEGTDGSPVYLYFTKDENAGSGISAFAFFSKGDTALPDFFSDGPVCVRTADGKAADLEEGIDGHGLYLFMIRNELCLPYVSDIKTVKVADGENLFEKLVSTGLDHYIEKPVCTSDGVFTYITYNRTADANDAVRLVKISSEEIPELDFFGEISVCGKDGGLYYSKSKDAGAPIYDITLGSFMSESFTLGDWARSYFGGNTSVASRIFFDETYEALTKSEEACTELPVYYYGGEDVLNSGLYVVTTENGGIFEIPTAKEEPKEENIYRTDGALRDTEDVFENEESEEKAVGSAIGGGSLIAISVFLAVAVILTVIVVMTSKKKDGGEENEKNS